jgi:acetylornithine/N-succinyldiaminopimelate aminotransferase
MPTLRQLFLANNAQTTNFPLLLEFERAEGVYMYDARGQGLYRPDIGHWGKQPWAWHPAYVIEAIKQQVDKYMHLMVYGEYVQTPQVRFAEKLVSMLPDNLQSVYFTNSGTEAVEGALKLSQTFYRPQQDHRLP